MGGGLRRDLLRGAAVTMSAASYSRVLGANDKIRLGLMSAGNRGQHDTGLFKTNPDVDVAAVCDIVAPPKDRSGEADQPECARLQRSSRTAGDEGYRRWCPDRHARSLACADRHRRAERRQGRLRGKAADAEDRRRAADREGGAHQRPHLPGRHAAALRASITCRPNASTSIPESWARSRWRGPGGTATAIICGKRAGDRCRRSLRTSTGRTSWGR